MKRHIYLEDIPIEDARAALREALEALGQWQPLGIETVAVADAAGRVTAAAVWAQLSSPHYHASAMDGYAVRAEDTAGATETRPRRLHLVEPDQPASAKSVERPALPVNTGQPLPAWADAVVMIEHTQPVVDDGGTQVGIEIRASLPPWKHVRAMGEDMVATELVLPANHRLRPIDLGALAGSGHATVTVYRRPRVLIIPTGSELVPVEKAEQEGKLQSGQIVEYNSIVLAGQVAEWGGLPTRHPIVADEFDVIREAVAAAAREYDLVLINAGSSAGSEDYTAHVVRELGELLVHGVAVRPGHPVIIGMIDVESEDEAEASGGRRVPVIGVPGYPVSAALTGEIFVEPLLARWQGQPPYEAPQIRATLTRKVLSPTGDDEYLRVTVGQVGERVTATPIKRGAGVISSLVRADGIVRIPRFSEGADAGTEVDVHLYRSPAEIARTIVAIGSHDLALDLLAQSLAAAGQGRRLVSANVGSLGGLVALRRKEAHLAGAHLLDPESGEYNLSYVRRYLPDRPVVLVTLVGREQGWIVPRGNPQGLSEWEDVARPEVAIVNRQRGAGTRVLLDYALAQRGIEPAEITGYEREEYTHLAVAAAVASGSADAGLGIRAAARALDLDFVPLAHERYDLVVPREHYESPLLAPLLALLHDQAFHKAVAAMPGYSVAQMGEVVAEL
ncbi:MAG: molybdopterin biosynthesis protein [Candidatus Promineifilaceae bacterium]|nr:molybdopterin biosynthesis protein [Candidatus Promineifilaceae bacterium]